MIKLLKDLVNLVNSFNYNNYKQLIRLVISKVNNQLLTVSTNQLVYIWLFLKINLISIIKQLYKIYLNNLIKKW